MKKKDNTFLALGIFFTVAALIYVAMFTPEKYEDILVAVFGIGAIDLLMYEAHKIVNRK